MPKPPQRSRRPARKPRVLVADSDVPGLLAALDLLVPPTALLALLDAAAILTTAAIAFLFGTEWWPVLTLTCLSAAAAAAVLAAWAREGRQFISPGALVRLPLYVVWKVPLYLRIGRGGAAREWLRTGR